MYVWHWRRVLDAVSAPLDQRSSVLQAVVRYQRLEALLQGQAPQGVLPPAPRSYVLERIHQLAKGTCLASFVWNGGGPYLHGPWTPDLPTDSALLLYLFCAYLEVRVHAKPESVCCLQPSMAELHAAASVALPAPFQCLEAGSKL